MDTIPKQIVRVFLAVLLLYGVAAAVIGFMLLRKWAAESVPLIVFDVLFFLGGTVMVSSALWLFGTVGRSRLALRVGGIASILNAANFWWATLTNVLPGGRNIFLDIPFYRSGDVASMRFSFALGGVLSAIEIYQYFRFVLPESLG